jgi:diguanylate cyclase (GGDEF)-like protein
MDSQIPTDLKIGRTPAKEIQATMRHLDRRVWRLWSYAVLVTSLLVMAVGSFAFPALLLQADNFYSFFLDQAVRGLTGLVLLFNVYVVWQQFQINRIRRQLEDQVLAVDKVEVLAQEVYKIAVLDSFTGLFNRRYMEQRLADEIARCQRSGLPMTVILFDLDEFKQVNDKYGHAAGDTLLKAFAEYLQKATRGSDVAGRYGGDEFLAVLPECKPEEVQFVLKRMDGLRVEIGEEMIPIGYSAGWAEHISGESPDELLKRADAALYANKRNGIKLAEAIH